MQKIYFKDSEGNKICGILSKSSGENKGTVILCHGFTTSKDSGTNKRLETELNRIGLSTLRFDFFGHGESEGDFEDITISKAVDSILNAVKFLKEIGENKIGLVGSSFGGISSMLATSKSKDIDVLALKSPVSDYPEVEKMRKNKEDLEKWERKGYVVHTNSQGEEKRLNYKFFEDAQNNIGYDEAMKIQIPVLIVHGDKDTVVPIEQSMKTSKIIKNCKLKTVKGADHKYEEKHEFEEMIKEIVSFMNEYYSRSGE